MICKLDFIDVIIPHCAMITLSVTLRRACSSLTFRLEFGISVPTNDRSSICRVNILLAVYVRVTE